MTLPIELRDVSKSFAGIKAVNAVSFDVRPGEVHALLGENGAGKSTLIKIMAGLHHPDDGEMLVNGQTVRFAWRHRLDHHAPQAPRVARFPRQRRA